MSENLPDLKPCPFCSYALTTCEGLCENEVEGAEEPEVKFTGICCPNCAVFLPSPENASALDCVNHWNNRSDKSEGLLPCPFCGGEPQRVDFYEGENFGGSVIACVKCDCSTAVHFGRKENLVPSWNRRTADSAHIARLKAAINWCIERDDKNGSLPEAYREKLIAAAE